MKTSGRLALLAAAILALGVAEGSNQTQSTEQGGSPC